jgi:hypothetical protein
MDDMSWYYNPRVPPPTPKLNRIGGMAAKKKISEDGELLSLPKTVNIVL